MSNKFFFFFNTILSSTLVETKGNVYSYTNPKLPPAAITKNTGHDNSADRTT